MKPILFSILACLFFSLNAVSQSCELSQVLLDEYEKDVKHLALLRMEQFNAGELDSVEIPQIWQDTIWKGLAAIYNSSSLARDQVFDQYCIHHESWTSNNYNRVSNIINVRLDTSAAWFQNWENDNVSTNDLYLDSLFLLYGVDSVKFSLPIIEVFRLHTDQLLNLDALANYIELNDQVIFAERGTGAGDYSRINYDYQDGEQFFDFAIGWGDCPSGCIYRQTWFFKVDESCNVTFLGLQEDEGIPDPINCSITTSTIDLQAQQSVLVFPNPFLNKINIEQQGFNAFNQYSLTDTNGKEIAKGQIVNHAIGDLNHLSPGIYFLRIEHSDKTISSHKVVKLK